MPRGQPLAGRPFERATIGRRPIPEEGRPTVDAAFEKARQNPHNSELWAGSSLRFWADIRAAHAKYDDRVFAWSSPPAGGHPGEAWNCRCTAEPIIDPQNIPEGAVCDILTGDRLASVFPDAPSDRLAAIARELDLRIVSGSLDRRERLIHFFSQMRMEAGGNARLEENLNYNPRGLRNTFSYFRDNPDDAELYGRTDEHPADQVSIANLAYANRNGNGNAESGDG